MGAVAVLDAGVLVALWDPEDGRHRPVVAAVRGLRDGRTRFVVPSTALAEVLVAAARQGDARLRTRMEQIRAAFGVPYAVDLRVAAMAAGLRAAHGDVRLCDAVVVAVARLVGAEEIVTVDPRWQAVDTRVRVIG
jgi:predicted nucleic acid-binding protein